MKIIEIKDRNDEILNKLVNIWEDSVKATHTFLNEQEIEHIKEYGPMTSKNVEHLMVVDNDEAVGFMEIENHKLEMLFIASNQRGKGLGKALLHYGMKNYDVCELTVNEQNPQAIGFYEVMGFKTYKKTELDEAGNPYPLLYMKLDR